jgi:hypothetical protein
MYDVTVPPSDRRRHHSADFVSESVYIVMHTSSELALCERNMQKDYRFYYIPLTTHNGDLHGTIPFMMPYENLRTLKIFLGTICVLQNQSYPTV